MSKVIPFRQIDGFGGCPRCRQNDGYLNIGRDHWFRCDRHRVKWLEGSNLFSSWRDENEAIWVGNAALLAEFVEVEPLTRPPRIDSEPLADSDLIPFS